MQGARTPSKATMAGSPTLTLWSFLPTQRSGKISGRCQTRGGTMLFQSSILTPLRSTVQKLQHLLLPLPPNLRLLLIQKVTMRPGDTIDNSGKLESELRTGQPRWKSRFGENYNIIYQYYLFIIYHSLYKYMHCKIFF